MLATVRNCSFSESPLKAAAHAARLEANAEEALCGQLTSALGGGRRSESMSSDASIVSLLPPLLRGDPPDQRTATAARACRTQQNSLRDR
mgnify:CR=1 FL=1